MKRLYFAIILCGVLISCTDSYNFTLNGSLDKSFYSDSIYLCTYPQIDTIAAGVFTDSTSFTIKGTIQESSVAFLKTSSYHTTTMFVLEQGEMELKGLSDTLFLVSGTPLNDVFSNFLIENKDVPKDSLKSGMKELMIEHSSDELGTLLGRSLAYSVDAEEYVEMYDRMDNHMRQDPFFFKLYKRSNRRIMSDGAMFSEIIGEIDGKPARLSDYAGRGSWVLLSFWASWCRDCQAEIPKLRKMYDLLQKDQIQFIGISRDDNPEKMKTAIERYDIVWPVINNTNGLESYTYGIVTIPSLILINPEGVVVAAGTTCEEFLVKINKALSSYNKSL